MGMDYPRDREPSIELSHEDRISALEDRIKRLDGGHGRLYEIVLRLAHRVGMDVPKEVER